ncbi:MAG: hypothetical protein AAF202_12675, partial [Pseudomonadota bacterium]
MATCQRTVLDHEIPADECRHDFLFQAFGLEDDREELNAKFESDNRLLHLKLDSGILKGLRASLVD